MAPMQAIAGSAFDGTYDYSYGFHGPGGWESHSVPSGFIVKNGYVTSNPAALSGTVSDNGGVIFSGPCPQGGYTAVFTGTIKADGTGIGTYVASGGITGEWSVARVSGPGFSSDIIDQIFDTLYDVGTAFGAPDDMAELVGFTVFFGLPFFLLVVALIVRGQRRNKLQAIGGKPAKTKAAPVKKRELGYTAAPPTLENVSTQGQAETPPGPIAIDGGGHRMEAIGEVRSDTARGTNLGLRAAWAKDHVTLQWMPPAHDGYQLTGYDIYELRYGPNSTAAIKTKVATLPPDIIQWSGPYAQTYKFSTGGDIEGYVVDALLSRFSSTGQPEFLKVGSIAFAPK